MNRQTAQQTQQESIPRQKQSLFRHHAAVRSIPETEHEPLPGNTAGGLAVDLTSVPVRPQAQVVGQTATRSCPMSPQRCPFGGACHSCPPGVQAKLKIGQPGDKYEQEADRVAEQVMRMPEPSVHRKGCSSCADKEDEENKLIQAKPLAGQITPLVQRNSESEMEEEDEDKILQAKPAGSAGNTQTVNHPLIQNVLSLPGQPLDTATRSFMEPRFGQDFSGVRVHTDGQAAESARAVNARAYTVGRDMVFGEGQYVPRSDEGKRLVAHELVHVGQQKQSPTVMMMREQLFVSTLETCRRDGIRSRNFHVSDGGVVVTANAKFEGYRCTDADYHITLNQLGTIFDSEYGTCDFRQGEPFSRQWSNLPEGDYYLQIWTGNTNPNCCLLGDIIVEQQSGLQGNSCTQPPPGPLEILHSALDAAGLFPALGIIPDAVNAAIYSIEGDWVNAGISTAAMAPIFGQGVTATKLSVKVTGEAIERVGKEGIEQGLKEAVEKTARTNIAEEAVEESTSVLRKFYNSIRSAPEYPKNFRKANNGTKKNTVKNRQLLDELRKVENGEWKKVYQDGYSEGRKVSIHYFQSRSGKVFNVKVKSGWSVLD